MTPPITPTDDATAARREAKHLSGQVSELTGLLTLAQIRKWHMGHTGYIWACPHCKDAYWAAAEREAPELLKV